MRELKFKDVFRFSEIIDKMGLKADINTLYDQAIGKGAEAQAWLGGQMTMLLISKVYLAEKEVTSFFADLTGKSEAEIENLKLKETKDLFSELFKSNDLAGFFNSATVEPE